MTESIIQPKMFKLPPLDQTVVLFFNLQHFRMFHNRVSGSKIKSFGPARRFQWKGKEGNITALGGMIGAPLAVMIAELALSSGAEKLYAFGSAGSTSDETVTIGELVVPERGYDETGICRDYMDTSDFQRLQSQFDVQRCRAITSVNSFFRLTRQNIERYRKESIQLIDMETTPLHCAITKHNKSFYPLFVISDQVSADFKWENGGAQKLFKQGIEAGLDLLAEL